MTAMGEVTEEMVAVGLRAGQLVHGLMPPEVVVRLVLEAAYPLIAQRERARGWEPIETVPKNGSWVVIGWFILPGQRTMEFARWSDHYGGWVGRYTKFSKHSSDQPTHWRPEPEPAVALYFSPRKDTA